MARGYFNKPQLTEEMFHATLENDSFQRNYLRTGDLAFFQNDNLYICGRIKDLIISNGVNYYPQDIEHVVQDTSKAVRPGCVAAFAREEVGNDGELEIVFEIRKSHVSSAKETCQAVRSSVIQNIGLTPSRVVAIAERTIGKTTSGKIQRSANRAKLHDGNHRVVFELSDSTSNDNNSSSGNDYEMGVAEGSRDGPMTLTEITIRFFGEDHDPDSTWEELGLSSMVAMELRQSIADNFAVSLPADGFEKYQTPSCLQAFIFETTGTSLPVELSELTCLDSFHFSWGALGLLQVIGILSLLLLFAVPIIPAWWAGQLVSSFCTVFTVGGSWIQWFWLPLAIPVWMVSFTLVVIVTKWVVIRKYREGEMRSPSIAYLRWWYVDRLMHVWEFWVGRFMLDTPLLVLVYIFLGARIHPTVQLKAFIREFDLVQIGKRALVEYKIGCRIFAPWERHEVGPTIRFRSVSIGKNSTVKGFLCPGATIGKGAIVEELSVVAEGTQVPEQVVARGNPAFNGGSAELQTSDCSWWQLGSLKLLWIVLELYMFFALLLVGQLMLNDRLPTDWRYTPLCYWFLLIAQSSISSVVTSIFLKWILIGNRRPGPYQKTLWRTFSDWAADYHYQISIMILFSVTNYSRLWTLILKCFGMDIDVNSMVAAVSIVPSKVDLISIKRSFVSIVTFDTKNNGYYHRTEVYNESSVGRNARVGPGVTISGATVAPLEDVNTNLVPQQNVTDSVSPGPSTSFIVRQETWIGLFSLLLVFAVLLSFIPSYEIWILVNPSSIYQAVPTLAAALLLATVTALTLLRVFQHAAYKAVQNGRNEAWSVALHLVSVTATICVHLWTFWSLLWGTPIYNMVAKLLGATIHGRMLYQGFRLCDPAFVSFDDRSVIDDSIVNGHYGMYKEMVVGPCNISGVLHPRTYAMANTVVKSKENGPLRSLVPSGSRFDTVSGTNEEKIASCV